MSTQLEQEILSQPEVLARVLERETQHVAQIIASLPSFQYIVIAARGTSDNAATYAQYAWGALAGHTVAQAAPSLQTIYHRSTRLEGALVIGVSQSGQSPDIIAIVEEGKRQGCPTIAITNDPQSPLATIADHVVELHAGPERSVAATKTYTAQLSVMALFAACWNGAPHYLEELQRLPSVLEAALQSSHQVQQQAERYRYANVWTIIGRGYNYATAFELALKLKELNYVSTTPYSSADFRHGPIATIEEGSPVALIMPSGEVFADLLELAHTLKDRRADLLIVSDNQQALSLATTPMVLPQAVDEWLSPLTAILPGQLLAMHLASSKGYAVDTPRGLNKVTLTW